MMTVTHPEIILDGLAAIEQDIHSHGSGWGGPPYLLCMKNIGRSRRVGFEMLPVSASAWARFAQPLQTVAALCEVDQLRGTLPEAQALVLVCEAWATQYALPDGKTPSSPASVDHPDRIEVRWVFASDLDSNTYRVQRARVTGAIERHHMPAGGKNQVTGNMPTYLGRLLSHVTSIL